MKLKPIDIYVYVTTVLALMVVVLCDWSDLRALSQEAVVGYTALIVLGLVSEVSAFSSNIGSTDGRSSLVFLPLVAAILLFGPVPAVGFIIITSVTAEFLIRKKDFVKALFNTTQYIVVTAVCSFLFVKAGGYPLAATLPRVYDFNPQVIPILVFGATALLLNHLAVAGAIALSQRRSIWSVLRVVFNRIWGTALNDLMVLPIAILVGFLYFELYVGGLLVALLPLLFIRYSYLAKFRLEIANRDLLQVLVKAIETRDPYTSGHSIRVQSLAKSIGEELGLSLRKIDELDIAALLHDVGKIEVVYEEILRKPDSLSEHERKIIESHVERGVQILTSLSSFNSRVIAGVRHHHELYDGSGYPDGLSGEKIPIYARIIKISDAIDAMLSTRPYRPALSIESVYSELEKFSGKHFDPELVEVIVGSSVLSQHLALMELERNTKMQAPSHEKRENLVS